MPDRVVPVPLRSCSMILLDTNGGPRAAARAAARGGVMTVHANAPLTPEGHLRLCLRVDAGRPIAHIAAEAGISRRCPAKGYARWRRHGEDGLLDHSSRPSASPTRTRRASPTWWKRRGGRSSTGLPGSPQNLSGCTPSPWRQPPHPRASRPNRTARPRPAGRTLLVEGGVGSAAVEIAVAQGATVIGTASERNHSPPLSAPFPPPTAPASHSASPLSLRTAST
jgi:hypothetical protein